AVVRRPDADAVTGIEAKREESGGEPIDGLPELAKAETGLLVAHHQRRTRRPLAAGLIEKLPDGFADQQAIAGAVDIAELKSGHCRSSQDFCEIIARNRARGAICKRAADPANATKTPTSPRLCGRGPAC